MNRTRELQLRKYGMTVEQYDEMLDNQGGVCAICWKTEDSGRRLAIDHNHDCCPPGGSCGRCVRGLLCARCNSLLLGHYSISQLHRAINYMARGEQALRNLNNIQDSIHLEDKDEINTWNWADHGYVHLN